jgi:hypothetical protein
LDLARMLFGTLMLKIGESDDSSRGLLLKRLRSGEAEKKEIFVINFQFVHNSISSFTIQSS